MDDNISNMCPAPTAASFLLKGQFRIRSLEEAHLLAEFIAKACPNSAMVALGIHEILVNAIEHGNLGISFDEKTSLKPGEQWLAEINRRLNLPQHLHQYVAIELSRQANEIILTVKDQGKGFDWKKYHDLEKSSNLRAMHGRGILMARNLAFKRLEYSECGNAVTCVISLI